LHRHLTLAVLFIVLGAGVMHAVWNAITKAIHDRLVVLGWIGLMSTILGAVGLVVTGLPPVVAIWFALGSAAIHVAYNFALINAYRLGTFNQMYPVARGTSPLIVAVGAAVLAHEHLSALALSGVLLLGAGLISLALSAGHLDRSEFPALGVALLTGLAIAGYSLVDGLGVRHTHDPYAYTALLFLAQGPVFVVAGMVRRRPAEWVANGIAWRGLVAGALSVIAYGAVIWAQLRAPLAEVAALRETGVISAAIIGALFFKEGFGLRRVFSAVVVACGIILIAA
jgi:drug/metabolite transporter (DMT)-like permease